MKRILTILCSVVMVVSLSACSTESSTDSKDSTDYSNQTLTGQVTSIDGTEVTLQLGELSMPEKPEGDDQTDGKTPPENSDEKDKNGDQTPPDGKSMKGFTAGDETVTFDLSGAEIQMDSRNESQEGTMDDIFKNSILVIEVGDNNKIKTVTIKSFGGQKKQEKPDNAQDQEEADGTA